MSKLEELIQELCPDGVDRKKLGEIATISRGGNFQKKDFCETGVPCIHYGQIYTQYGLWATETFTYISDEVAAKQKFATKGDIVMAVNDCIFPEDWTINDLMGKHRSRPYNPLIANTFFRAGFIEAWGHYGYVQELG